MKTKGWTILEMLIVLALVSIIMSIAMHFFFSGQRQSHNLDFRLHALQSAYLLRVRLADDIASSIPASPTTQGVDDASGITLRRVTTGPGKGISGTHLDSNLRTMTEDIVYQFDPNSHRLLRNGRAVGTARFLDVSFSYIPFAEPAQPEMLEVHAIVVPEEHLRSGDRKDFPQQELVTFTFHCPQSTTARAFSEYPPLY